MVSKGYNTINNFVENTNDYSFVYSNNCVNLTNGACLESSNAITQRQYFKLGLVIEFPTQNVTDKMIFKHNDLELKIVQEVPPSNVLTNTTIYMIGLYDNGTFIRGVTFKPSDLTFKYFIYCDQASNLIVSGNTSTSTNNITGSFSYGSDHKVYINDTSTYTKNAGIKFYECLYFQSTSNDIAASSSNMWDYFSPRWGLTTYNDIYNIIPPDLTTWTSPYSSGNRLNLITLTKSADLVVHGTLNGMIDGSNLMYGTSFWFNYENVAGKFIQFELETAQIIDAFQIISDHRLLDNSTTAIHLFQGSQNGSTWTTLTQFGWGGNTGTTLQFISILPVPVSGVTLQNVPYYNFVAYNIAFQNLTAYKYYRTLGVSGNDTGGPYQTEILFKSSSY